MHHHKSEIARFREQQALEEQSAYLGLYGLAAVASHDAIIARMEIGGQRILQLLAEGKEDEAHALMNTEWWGEYPEEEQLPTLTRIASLRGGVQS